MTDNCETKNDAGAATNDAASNDALSNDVASNDAVKTNAEPTTHRATRGRYAKFNGAMDVMLLEVLREHNPFTAKHGTRLQMWQFIAETVGQELFKNPETYSWHTCRDRVTALMKMYADGKHDKLFKHGTVEENARKDAILRELNLSIARKHTVPIRPATSLLDSNGVVATSSYTPSTSTASSPSASSNVPGPRGVVAAAAPPHLSASNSPSAGTPSTMYVKRRRLENSNSSGATNTPNAESNSSTVVTGTGAVTAVTAGPSASCSSDAFRARVLALLETKVAFDTAQRVKETALREQEIALQKRFLEYLQSK